jgi:hypothetical protein
LAAQRKNHLPVCFRALNSQHSILSGKRFLPFTLAMPI